MNLINNGIIIQDLDSPTNYMASLQINYLGINAFHHYPLIMLGDAESKSLNDEVPFKKLGDGSYQQTEFIKTLDLARRYISCCDSHNIQTRALFIKSNCVVDGWIGTLPDMTSIGYEYCEIPFDSQIITDFDWYLPLRKNQKKLNKYGLFDTLDDVLQFKNDYDKEFRDGNIGDGEMSPFVCHIYEINKEHLLSNNIGAL